MVAEMEEDKRKGQAKSLRRSAIHTIVSSIVSLDRYITFHFHSEMLNAEATCGAASHTAIVLGLDFRFGLHLRFCAGSATSFADGYHHSGVVLDITSRERIHKWHVGALGDGG